MSPPLQSNLRALCHILFILLQQTYAQSVFTPATPTCPGDNALFTCAVTDVLSSQSTTWKIGSSLCQLDHDTPDDNATCGPGDVFTALLRSPPVGDVYTSTLTVTAAISLDKISVECLFGGTVGEQRLDIITPPQLPDAVRKDHSQDMVDRTTVINWQPATVDSASDSVTYSVTSSNLDLIDFDNTTTTATVRLPAFNTDYSFCVYAVNVCGSTSGAPRCATPPVMIEAEGPVIADLTTEMICSVEPLSIKLRWTVAKSRTLQLPVTSLTVVCNGVSRGLTTTATEFTFTDAGCVSATAASITLTATNEVGSTISDTSVSPVYRTPVMSGGTLQIQGGAVCIQLNPNCLEAPSYQGFTAELQFTLNDNKTIIVFGELSQCNNGVSGFKFSLKRELELETIPVTITFVSNGTVIETINGLNVLQEPDSRVALGAGVGGGVCGLVAVSVLANLLLHAGLVHGWGHLCLLGWAGPCCHQENTKMRMHRGLAFCVLLFYLTPVTTVLLTCYLCHLCYCKHSGDKEGKQVDVAMEANLYGPVPVPASEDRHPLAPEAKAGHGSL